jgi:hypothetical protein
MEALLGSRGKRPPNQGKIVIIRSSQTDDQIKASCTNHLSKAGQ